jgi:DNA repair exonuclease SbcCD ATPase subunit
MSAEKSAGKTAKADTDLSSGGNIDNIREILFGAQMRQYEKRFQRLEELLAKELADLRKEMKRRLDALETFTKQESDALGERIKAEKDERKAGLVDVGKEIAGLTKDLEKKAGRLEDLFGKGLKELRSKLLEQSKALSEDLRSTGDSLLENLGKDIEELRQDKTDRAALISLFNEMALRLGEELHLPEVEE